MISTADLALVLFLVFLEGILSIDNALVLAMLARGLPKNLQRKALTYGLVGAVAFRVTALLLLRQLLEWKWIKILAGAYLIFLALKHLFASKSVDSPSKKTSAADFWKIVITIELTDVAFALDSIMAAIALTQKFWIILTGGMLGIVMMRFAASLFISVLKKFPSFETSAYLMVLLIGIKVSLETLELSNLDFQTSSSPAAQVFWGLMGLAFIYGFKRKSKSVPHSTGGAT